MLRCACGRRYYLVQKSHLVRKRSVEYGRSVDKEIFFMIICVFQTRFRAIANVGLLLFFYFYSHSKGNVRDQRRVYRVNVLASR